MKSDDEIKKGLECCTPVWKGNHWKTCDVECPYAAEMVNCRTMLDHDALDLIQQLQAENAQQARCIENMTDKLNAMNDEVAKLKAERDAAVADMAEIVGCPCGVCKHYLKDGRKEPCNSCRNIRRGEESHFEWRGVQKD